MRAVMVLAWVAMTACAGKVPLPEAHRVADAAALQSKMAANGGQVTGFRGELSLTYFGSEGRVRTSGFVVASRPNRLRYNIEGPHGGVLNGLALDGETVRWFDVAASRFVQAPSTPENLDRLLGLVPLSLGADGWVRLLFGELPPMPDATLRYDDSAGVYELTWASAGATFLAQVDPATARLESLSRRRGDESVRVVISERHESGVPSQLEMTSEAPEARLRVGVSSLELNPRLQDAVFTIAPPPGLAVEQW